MRAAIIINPVSGARGRRGSAADKIACVRSVFANVDIDARTFVTERQGHARAIARRAVDERYDIVFAWGGDGTVNEVGCGLMGSTTPMALIPAGSGNGLAASLGIPSQPEVAMRRALDGRDRSIDVGEFGGRLFFNVAGLGFDAHVAKQFEASASSRGFRSYLRVALRELPGYRPVECTVRFGDEELRQSVDLLALANGPEYGNGARIAPLASLDDGELDLVVADGRSTAVNIWRAIRLMSGRFSGASGVLTRKIRRVTVQAPRPILFHVDGEVVAGGTRLEGFVHPRALVVRDQRPTN